MKKKITFLLANLDDGGVERVFINLATGLLLKGYSVEFVVFQKEGRFSSEVPAEINIHNLNSINASKSLFPLIRYLRENKPDVFVSGKHYINVIASLAKIISKSSSDLVLTVHGMFPPSTSKSQTVLKKLVQIFYPKAKKVVCVSQGVAKNVSEIGALSRDKIEVIYNPVITLEFKEKLEEIPNHDWLTNKKAPVIISAGRLSNEKDFITLVKAFSRVIKKREAKLIILGDGPERERIESFIEREALEQHVSLPGYVSNPLSYMGKADLFVLSSITEGLSNVIIEALYCGLPIVSTDCPSGPKEVLDGGKYGELVEVKNEVEMANAIIKKLDQQVNKDKQQKRALDFTLENALMKYIKVIES